MTVTSFPLEMPAATMPAARPTAVVLGGGLGALGVVRSLGQAGIPVAVADETPHSVAMASRHARKLLVSSFDGPAFIQDLLGLERQVGRGAVLIFTDDRPLLAASRYRDRLAGHFLFRLPSHALLEQLASKEVFHRLAESLAMPVPRTVTVRSLADLDAVTGLQPPLAVKPSRFSPEYRARFAKAYRVATAAEACGLCRSILEQKAISEIIVQEWIEGGNGSIYFCLQYLSETDVLSFTGRKLRSWPPQIGITASCVAAPEADDELTRLTTRFLRGIGFNQGLASVEFKRDSRNGRFVMVEPTVGRTNWQEEIATLCGVNLPLAAYCDATGLPRSPARFDPRHVWRNEFTDWRSAWRSRIWPSLPAGNRVHYAHWRWNDPRPAIAGAEELGRRVMKALFKIF